MREMGWSWADLLEAPAVVVEEIAFRISEQIHWISTKKRLDEEGADA